MLVVRGEAGVAKTALLDYAIGLASDMLVVRATGLESEMELAFAALHQVWAPLVDRLQRSPVPQRHALEIAFGLQPGLRAGPVVRRLGGPSVCSPRRLRGARFYA